MQLAGQVNGNVLTNGGNIVKTAQITGLVNNNYFSALPAVSAPSWSGSTTSVSGSKAISGGTLLAPNQYKYSSVSGTLHVTGTVLSGLGSLLGSIPVVSTVTSSEADIYINGDFNGTLIVDAGVQVHLYVSGNATFGPNALQNVSNIAANVQIFGVPSTTNSAPSINIDTTGSPAAAIYAPLHAVTLSGNGNFSGALTGASLDVAGAADVHFDEALALQTGPVLGYELVSWQELNVQ